jgi:hypothetical protein
MSGDRVARPASGRSGRGRQRQLLDQVQDFAGQPGREAGRPGDELAGRGQDYFRPAVPDRVDDLTGGPLLYRVQSDCAGKVYVSDNSPAKPCPRSD